MVYFGMKSFLLLLSIFVGMFLNAQTPPSLANTCYVIGHRGAPGYGGENTLFGFQKALDLGADGFELDLIQTKDGQLIVGHDYELNRLIGEEQLKDLYPDRMHENGDWIVTDFTQDELQRLKVTYPIPGAERPDYSNLSDDYKMPVLQDAIALLIKNRKEKDRPDLKLYIEIKTKKKYSHTMSYQDVVASIYEDLAKFDLLEDQNIWIQSFDFEMMDEVVKHTGLKQIPKTQLGMDSAGEILSFRNKRKVKKFLKKKIIERDLQMLHIWKVPTKYFIDKRNIPIIALAHDKNIPLHLYTFRDPNFESDYKYLDKFGVKGFESKEDELSFFISKGVDAIMTDYITSALAIRNQLYDQTAKD